MNVEGFCSHWRAPVIVVTGVLPGNNELKILKTRVGMFPGYIDATNTCSERYIVGRIREACVERQGIRKMHEDRKKQIRIAYVKIMSHVLGLIFTEYTYVYLPTYINEVHEIRSLMEAMQFVRLGIRRNTNRTEG